MNQDQKNTSSIPRMIRKATGALVIGLSICAGALLLVMAYLAVLAALLRVIKWGTE